MMMQEPIVEFVPIDMSEIVTGVSKCTDDAQRSSMTVCDCTDNVQGEFAGCVGDIV